MKNKVSTHPKLALPIRFEIGKEKIWELFALLVMVGVSSGWSCHVLIRRGLFHLWDGVDWAGGWAGRN